MLAISVCFCYLCLRMLRYCLCGFYGFRLAQDKQQETDLLKLWQINLCNSFWRSVNSMWANRLKRSCWLPSLREVAAVLNLATETARNIVANGDIVDFGDLGTLKPSFKSRAVEKGKPFRVQEHIENPVVRLVPSRKYFTLTDVVYEQVPVKKS